jgi:hypothetical protein
LNAIKGAVMLRTIEALYKNGKIVPQGDAIPVREAIVCWSHLSRKKKEKRRKFMFNTDASNGLQKGMKGDR